MKMKTEKQSVAKEMAREITSDLGSLVSRSVSRSARVAVNVAKTTAKVASLPLVGMLSQDTRERIYGDEKWADAAFRVSGFTNIPLYAYLGSLAASSINEDAFGGLGSLGYVSGIIETAVRFLVASDTKSSLGSVIGYLPSKAIDYVSRKYDNAKKNIERGVKGGDE